MNTRRQFLESSAGKLVVSGLSLAGVPITASPLTQTITRLDGSRVSAKAVADRTTQLMAAAKVPGLGVAVLNQGRVAYLRGFGLRNQEQRLPLTEDTVMYGASFTKAAFGYMVMQLVDEGLLDLDRPVHQYLPKPLPAYEKYADLAVDERHKLITARMLLSHTPGFPNFRFLNPDNKLDIKFQPGSRYAYSGEGINLLGFVVEIITGKSVGDLMQSRVFDPCRMPRTSMTWQPRFESNHAVGYDEQQKPLGHQRRQSPRAAGSMDTTLADYAKFLEAVLQRRGLSAQSWQALLSPQIRIHSKSQFPTLAPEIPKQNDDIQLAYGLGWGVFQTPYGKAYFKEGHDDGWENHSVCFDHNKTAVILMSNSSNGDGIFKELLAFLIGDTFTPWEWEGYVPYDRKKPE